MNGTCRNVKRNYWIVNALSVGFVICVGGICSLFAQTNTEHNKERILSELQIDATTFDPNILIPEISETPPKIVEQVNGDAREIKLFYFCKQHTSDELKKITHEQLANNFFDNKAKSQDNLRKLIGEVETAKPDDNLNWITWRSKDLLYLLAIVVPVIVTMYSYHFKLSSRVTRIETSLDENVKPQLTDVQSKIAQLQVQLTLLSKETISASLMEKLNNLVDDIRKYNSGSGKNSGILPPDAHGRIYLPFSIEELSKQRKSKTKKKPTRTKKEQRQSK